LTPSLDAGSRGRRKGQRCPVKLSEKKEQEWEKVAHGKWGGWDIKGEEGASRESMQRRKKIEKRRVTVHEGAGEETGSRAYREKDRGRGIKELREQRKRRTGWIHRLGLGKLKMLI